MRSAFLRGPRPSYVLAMMVAFALLVAFPVYEGGAPLLGAAFFGAVLSVFGTWFLAFFGSRLWRSIRPLPPYYIGDLVVVVSGPLTGTTGKVREMAEADKVLVDLQDGSGIGTFGRSEVARL